MHEGRIQSLFSVVSRQCRRLFGLVAIVSLSGLLLPASAWAQTSAQSSTFKLENINFGSEVTLSTNDDSAPPTISAQGPVVTELDATKATIEWTTDKKSSSLVKYGQTTTYGLEGGAAGLTIKHKVTLFGLIPETTYHYKAVSADALDASSESADATFTTPAETQISSIKISDIGYDKALVTWKTGSFSVSTVEYGETGSYGKNSTTASRSFTTDHTVQLTGLKAGTEYHYRIVAEDEKGTVVRSNDLTFTTIPEPRFSNITATPQNINEVLVRWDTNTPTSAVIKYRATSGPVTDEQTAGSAALEIHHAVTLKGLVGNTVYNYEITATDDGGKQIKSGQRTFATPLDKDAPLLTDLKVSVTRSGDELVLTASWKSNEPAKSEIVYGPKTRADATINIQGSSNYLTDFTVVTSGLTPSTPYSLTAFSTDAAGNRGQTEISFVTPKFNKTILQLLLETFFAKFGWLLNLVQK